MTPEEKARQQIDAMLTASGWAVQTKDKINLSAARGVAIGELFFEPDYVLFFDFNAIGTTEAKPEGVPLAEQTRIVAEVARRLSVVEELESVVSANLQRATRLRQSILQKAFTGGLCEPDAIHHHQEAHDR